MSRIGAVGLLTAGHLQVLKGLTAASDAITKTTERLSTLKKINHSADNPSGMVFAQRLQSELDSLSAARSNVTRVQSLISTADDAASDVVTKLTEARTLALEVAGGGLSSQQVADKQAALDEILNSINRSAQASYNGTRLLDGTAGYRLSGVDTAKISDIDVLSKNTTSDVTFSVNVTTTALQGTKSYAGGALGADATLEVDGPDGTATIELSNGATTYDIEDAFNAVTYLTGVTATRVDATNVTFTSVDYGSAAEFTITPTTGSFTTTGTGTGRDAIATINGTSVTADGTVFAVSSNQVSLTLEIAAATSGAIADFTVTGNGLQFQLSSDPNDVTRVGLGNLTTAALGGSTGKLSSLVSGGDNSLSSDPLTAIQIIDEAFSEATSAQARIGAFSKYTLDSATAILDSQETNTTAAYSDVMDVDVAEETARLTQQQLQQQAGLEALKVLNLQSASVLSVLQTTVARW